MTAEDLVRALSGRRTGRAWIARCPVHDDRRPSLPIAKAKNGKVLVHCHAGCDQRDVIAALRIRGAWDGINRGTDRLLRKTDSKLMVESDPGVLKRLESALAVWRASLLPQQTEVEVYLRSRSIAIPVPASIRFHVGLRHSSGGIWPSMVALVTRGFDGKPIGIHRTFLASDGSGKAPVEPAKMMLGPCQGGAVRLADSTNVLMVGEGIETCLAAIQATGHPAWAALSTSGMRGLKLPQDVRDVIVLADGDEAGETAARDCAGRWKREGRRVRIARPPWGMDFNDLLMLRAPLNQDDAR